MLIRKPSPPPRPNISIHLYLITFLIKNLESLFILFKFKSSLLITCAVDCYYFYSACNFVAINIYFANCGYAVSTHKYLLLKCCSHLLIIFITISIII